jgi:hypothetical protein
VNNKTLISHGKLKKKYKFLKATNTRSFHGKEPERQLLPEYLKVVLGCYSLQIQMLRRYSYILIVPKMGIIPNYMDWVSLIVG